MGLCFRSVKPCWGKIRYHKLAEIVAIALVEVTWFEPKNIFGFHVAVASVNSRIGWIQGLAVLVSRVWSVCMDSLKSLDDP